MTDQKNTFQRQTALITSLKELLEGRYVVQEGWKPNYIQTPTRRLVRINVMAIIVEKPNPYQFLIDDGSASILVSDFNQKKKTTLLKVGDPVLVIGRPRQSDDGLFIAAEIATSDQLKEQPLWIVHRKDELRRQEELLKNMDSSKIIVPEVDETVGEGELVEPLSGSLSGDDVIEFMRKKDDGDGVAIEEIVSYFGKEADDVILTLMSMGEVYEIKPGRIKILE